MELKVLKPKCLIRLKFLKFYKIKKDFEKLIFYFLKKLDYLADLCWFRLYSFDKVLANGVVTDGGEASITKEKTLKNWGKALYTQYTGKTDYSTFISKIASLVDDYNE